MSDKVKSRYVQADTLKHGDIICIRNELVKVDWCNAKAVMNKVNIAGVNVNGEFVTADLPRDRQVLLITDERVNRPQA